MFVYGFAYIVLPEAASNRFSRRANLPAACGPRGVLQKWVGVRADTLRSPESAFVRPRRQFFSRHEGRGAPRCGAGGQPDVLPHWRAIGPVFPRTAGVCPQGPQGARANTN